jgi:hypothetical protein
LTYAPGLGNAAVNGDRLVEPAEARPWLGWVHNLSFATSVALKGAAEPMSMSGGRAIFALIVAANVVFFGFSPLEVLQHVVNTPSRFVAAHSSIEESAAAVATIAVIELSLAAMNLVARRALKRIDWTSNVEKRLYLVVCASMAVYNALFLTWYLALWADND